MTFSNTGLAGRPEPSQAPHRGGETSTAEQGARWITVGALFVGALNYGYALVLTRLLDVRAFSVFAAGQRLSLCVTSVAVVAIPWMLAQALARAGSDADQVRAVRFAALLGALTGVAAAGVVAGIAREFADTPTTSVLAAGTLLMFVTTTTLGWLQGRERLRTLACLNVTQAAVKLAAGVLLVAVLGLSDTGALAALGICVVPFLFWWPYRTSTRPVGRGAAHAHRNLGRTATGIAAVQALVALVATVDVVLATVLPMPPSDAASYQASVMVGRVPLFLAGAISTAFFPALSRRGASATLTASAVRMYLTLAVAASAVCATIPPAVLGILFPSAYGRMSVLLAFAAVSGCAVGALNLAATLFQAIDDFRCLRAQLLGFGVYLAALLVGWRVGGVVGYAAGTALGTVVAAALLVGRLVRRQGTEILTRPVLTESLLVIGVLVVLRPLPVAWLAAALIIAARTAVRFLRDRGGHGRRTPAPSGQPPDPPTPSARAPSAAQPPGDRTPTGPPRDDGPPKCRDPSRILREAVWAGTPLPTDDDTLRRALALARRNQVEGRLARAYPHALADTAAQAEQATRLFRRNLAESTDRLRAAGIPMVLIKADLTGDYTYNNFDLVVPPGQWQAGRHALAPWTARSTSYWLERSTKVLLWPAHGPAVHLHTAVCWFGIPVVPTGHLLDRATPADDLGCLLPDEADALRIWLAHALFQNLTFNLAELLALRPLLKPDVIDEALRESAAEGWGSGCRSALAVATAAIARLDRGDQVRLPVPLPVPLSFRVAAEHAYHLARGGPWLTAAREVALRVPLVLTKKLRGGST